MRQERAWNIVNVAERLLRLAGSPKINLQARTANRNNITFYQRPLYLVDEIASMGKRLEHDMHNVAYFRFPGFLSSKLITTRRMLAFEAGYRTVCGEHGNIAPED